MKNDNRWKMRHKLVAVAALTAPAILGVGGAATSATAAPVASSTPIAQAARLTVSEVVAVGGNSGGMARGKAATTATETRGLVSIVIAAIKSVSGLWSKFSAAVKQTFARFDALWKGIKSAIGAIGTAISAWEIWNYFH